MKNMRLLLQLFFAVPLFLILNTSVLRSQEVEIQGDIHATDDLYFGSERDPRAASIISYGDLVFHKDYGDEPDGPFYTRFYTDEGDYEQMRIVDGDEAPVYFDGLVHANGLDYAEAYKITDVSLEAGELVSIMPEKKEYIKRSEGSYDSMVFGVISGSPGFITGQSFDAEEAADAGIADLRDKARKEKDWKNEKKYTIQLQEKMKLQQRAVALAGRVPVKVDSLSGIIKAGDYLTSGPTPGCATAMTRSGKTIGMALEGWDGQGEGTILALIQPGWYGGRVSTTVVEQEKALAEKDQQILELTQRISRLEKLVQQVADTNSMGSDTPASID